MPKCIKRTINPLHILLMVVLVAFSSAGFAGTYWVSPTGTATWSNCSASTPLSGTSACSLATANANASAGDIVYIRGGTYPATAKYSARFNPSNSGSSGNMIIFMAYSGETPELVCSDDCRTRGWGLYVSGKSYIKIYGITFTAFTDNLISNGSHHIEITNCTFNTGGGLQMVELCAGGAAYNCYISHLWIHHNKFYKLAKGGGCSGSAVSEGGDAVRVGYPCGTGGAPGQPVATEGLNHHITIENNIIGYAGHATMDHYSTETVVKNNVFYNAPWYPENNGSCTPNFPATNYTNADFNGYYSHRNYQLSDDFNRDTLHALVEGNRLGHAGVNPNNDGANNLDIAGPKNIIRYNTMFNSMHNNVLFKYSPLGGCGSGRKGGTNNKFYNNTIYRSGYGYPFYETCAYSVCPGALQAIKFYVPETTGNVIKNNLVYDSRRYALGGTDIENHAGNTITNNWLTSNGNPNFVNTDLTQIESTTLPDLRLQSNSGAISAGIHLTTAIGSGNNSTTLVVDDALYFQDGTWGSDLARNVTHFPDWIAIGAVKNIVQISSINYNTNTINLKSPMTWSDGANIWLYKKSDGAQVLYGSAPDCGAHEFNPEGVVQSLTPPANLRLQ